MKFNAWNYKTPRKKIGDKYLGFGVGNDFFLPLKAKETNAKIIKWYYIKLKKDSVQLRKPHRKSERTIYRKGDNICK